MLFLAAFGLAIAASRTADVVAEGPLTIAGGLLVVVYDVCVRLVRDPSENTARGPRILYLPAWALGVVWIALGAYDTLWPGA